MRHNIDASLEIPGINGCWLEGEWTGLGGCCSEAEEIPPRLVDWTPSPIPDWEETDEPWELNCTDCTMSYKIYFSDAEEMRLYKEL